MRRARGVLAVWNDLAPGHAREFDTWYQRQHMPERLSIAGFLEARRYRAARGSPRYCAFYWLERVDVLASQAYLECLANPTRWTRRTMPWFRNMGRTPAMVTLDHGHGIGARMRWLAASPEAGDMARLRAELDAVFRGCVAADPSVVRLQLWEADRRIAGQANPEQRLRAAADEVADWIVFLDATDVAALDRAVEPIVAVLARCTGAQPRRSAARYCLTWALSAAEAPCPAPDPL